MSARSRTGEGKARHLVTIGDIEEVGDSEAVNLYLAACRPAPSPKVFGIFEDTTETRGNTVYAFYTSRRGHIHLPLGQLAYTAVEAYREEPKEDLCLYIARNKEPKSPVMRFEFTASGFFAMRYSIYDEDRPTEPLKADQMAFFVTGTVCNRPQLPEKSQGVVGTYMSIDRALYEMDPYGNLKYGRVNAIVNPVQYTGLQLHEEQRVSQFDVALA